MISVPIFASVVEDLFFIFNESLPGTPSLLGRAQVGLRGRVQEDRVRERGWILVIFISDVFNVIILSRCLINELTLILLLLILYHAVCNFLNLGREVLHRVAFSILS